MASRIILDPETLLAQAGEMQSLTAEYESLFSKVKIGRASCRERV